MKVHIEPGDHNTEWSPEATAFAAKLGELANADRETAEIIVHVAMNIIGSIAFHQGVEPEAVVARVITSAKWQMEQHRLAAAEPEPEVTH